VVLNGVRASGRGIADKIADQQGGVQYIVLLVLQVSYFTSQKCAQTTSERTALIVSTIKVQNRI
jgi:hypothetical protein